MSLFAQGLSIVCMLLSKLCLVLKLRAKAKKSNDNEYFDSLGVSAQALEYKIESHTDLLFDSGAVG